MYVLIIDAQAEKDIYRLKEFAELNPISLETVKNIIACKEPPIGNNPFHVCLIYDGFRCVFSIEEHKDKIKVRHLSVSVKTKGKWPNEYTIQEIMLQFGFRNRLKDSIIYLEKKAEAVNVIERLK